MQGSEVLCNSTASQRVARCGLAASLTGDKTGDGTAAAEGGHTYKSRGYAQIRIKRVRANPYHRDVCISPIQRGALVAFQMRLPEIIGRPD